MACHNIEVYVSTNDENGDPISDWASKKDTVQTWVDNHNEVLNTQSSSMSLLDDPIDGGTPHARGSWRFHWDEDPVALKDDVATWLTNNFEWWRVRYHECSHDEESPTPCSWQNSWEHGTVPSDIPDV